MRSGIRLLAICVLTPGLAFANSTPQTLPFSQNWSNAGLITVSDDWTGVPGIEGLRGDALSSLAGTDPQTVLTEGTPVLDVNANQSNASTFSTGGVSEFDLADDVVALAGSGTADAPHLLIHLNTTGNSNIAVSYNLRDIDGSVDNSIQAVALQYRIGNTGNFINVPAAFVADASTGPSIATLVTAVTATLPAAADNQALVQIRIITNDAAGSDEYIGIDDISVTGAPLANPGVLQLSSAAYSIAENASNIAITVTRTGGSAGSVSIDYATSNGSADAGVDYTATSGTLTLADGINSATFTITVLPDALVEGDETVNLTLSNPIGGATLGTINTGVLTITNVSGIATLTSIPNQNIVEGNLAATALIFTVNISEAAPPGGTEIALAYIDGTATSALSDYSPGPANVTVAAGQTSAQFNVGINGDIDLEADETFTVNATLGATTLSAAGTINNDDVAITPIHSIQGSGNASPVVGTSVGTIGIVTGVRNTGFFLQTADADADADPATSQGIFIFTSTAPTVVKGDRVRVVGNVVEFFQFTEITAPVITVLSSGNAIPASTTLTAADGVLASPERYESMRVTPNLTVVAPAGGNENEVNATSTSTGNFHGVLPGVARPFREPGVSVLDTFVPAVGVTRFDGNLELIVVQSRGLGGLSMNTNAGDILSNITGILDFGFGFYKFYPDSGQTFTTAVTPTAVSNKTADEFTVAGFNLFRFFDSVNDPANTSDPVLTTIALNNRLAKTSDAICTYLKTPDIIGVVEVENIGVLTQLANTINSGQVATGAAVPSCNQAPNYVPYLVEGNDVGGIDVGFLISAKIVGSGSTPRVEVLAVVQENKNEIVINPDATTGLLNDRPTLRLQAVIHDAKGAAYPVTVMINHMRSLSSVNDPVDGARVRNKRLKQAESVAKLIQARQVANPNEKIILLGDFNAFEFNDGFTDSMGIITGKEVPASQVTLHSGFVVTTPLTNMTTVDVPTQRYSFSFDGNAQSLDHAVVNEPLLMQDGVRSEHARINADFAIINYGIYTGAPIRVSDHDPVIVYIKPRAFEDIDLAVAVSNPDTTINSGTSTVFTVNASNLNPSTEVDNARVNLILDAAINGVTVTAANGWSCTAPVVVAASTSITCTTLLFQAAGQASFSVNVPVPQSFTGGNLTLSAAISADQGDSTAANNISSDFVAVIGQIADLSIRVFGAKVIYIGRKSNIHLVAVNEGPESANNTAIAITTNGPANALRINPPAGWACQRDTSFATARFLCSSNAGLPMPNGARPEFVLTFVAPESMAQTNLIVGAGISSDTADTTIGNNEDSYSLFVDRLRRTGPPSPPRN